MATKKITELPAATTPLTGAEVVEMVQSGVSVRGTVTSVLAGVDLNVQTTTVQLTEQVVPGAGLVTMYWRQLGGFPVLAYRTPNGPERIILPGGGIRGGVTFATSGVSSTTMAAHGMGVPGGSGVVTNPGKSLPAALVRDAANKVRRDSGAGANGSAGWTIDAGVPWWYRRVSGAAAALGAGGFFFHWRTSFFLSAGHRAAAGLYKNASLSTQDPSALVDMLAFAKDAGDTNWQIMHNDSAGVAVKVDTGWDAVARSGHTFDVYVYSAAETDFCGITVIDADAGDEFTATFTTELPTVDQGLVPRLDVGIVATGVNAYVEVHQCYSLNDF